MPFLPHETSLIATIVMGLVLAFGFGFVATRLRLPPLIGYLLAGVAVGPFTPGFVADGALAAQLAEIGVILLMFGVGLHFSISDLKAVYHIALPGAVAQIATATAIGTAMALFWGWGIGAGLVLGLALSVASTVVLLRALAERGELDSGKGRIAVGWLIVEDLAMVLTLVLLPALAGPLTGGGHGLASRFGGESVALTVALTLGKVGLFVAIVLLVGKRAIPWMLVQVARAGSRELFTLAVLAVALGIAYGSAVIFGVSFALGAFFAGVVLSESDLSHRAGAESLPLQDAFAVLFFVSVGMLFDPTILVREPLAVAAVVLVIVFGKSIAAFALVLALGYPLATALTVSASLAQIGEFSFILAGLGLMLGLLPQEGQDLILAGAMLSIALNPLVFAAVHPATSWFERHPRLLGRLERSSCRATPAAPDPHGMSLQSHAVLVGCGRVGGPIASALEAFDLPFTVVERERGVAEAQRAQGRQVIYGDASAEGMLTAAGIARARLLIIATPGGFQAQRAIELAREANPGIDIVVRTHSESELEHLTRDKVGLAVLGEQELALAMMSYALRSLGLGAAEARLYVESARGVTEPGAVPRPAEEKVPELRRHH